MEDHSGALVEFIFDCEEVLQRIVGKGDALGEVVAQQAVGVLVCAACHGDRESQK